MSAQKTEAAKAMDSAARAKNRFAPPTSRLMALAIATLALTVALFFFRSYINDVTLLILLGILAVAGVFYLFASIAGFVTFQRRDRFAEVGRRFVDCLEDGICIVDDRNVVVFANPAYRQLIGHERTVDVQSPDQVLVNMEDAANALYRLTNSASLDSEVSEEFRLTRTISGESERPSWYRASLKFILGASGEMLKVWRLADVTAQRDNQELYFLELQKAIDHLDRSPVGFFACDAGGAIQYVNATLADWLDIDLTRFVAGSERLDDIVVGDSLPVLQSLQAEPGTYRTVTLDAILSKGSGQSLPAQLIHRIHADLDGHTISSRTIVLAKGVGSVDASESGSLDGHFARFFNSTPMAIASIDSEGRIIRTNNAFSRMFGSVDDSAVLERTPFANLIAERDRERFCNALEAVRRDQARIDPFETSPAEQGGDERHMRIFVNAVSGGADGQEDEVAVVQALDMTEQKALEAQMAQSQKMQAVGQLAGGIAHDFNNVLTAIIMASDLLLTSHRPSDPSFGDIMNIKQNANRAASLVRQLLAFSRRQTLRPETLNLTDVLADLRMLLSRLIGNNIDLTIDHGRDLWPVKADLGQFEQVIVNLTVNARDAMPEGGHLTIRTRNMEEEEAATLNRRGLHPADFVVIEVEDSGTGIDPDVLQKIFEPFFTTKEVGKGTGLGLSMVYGIIKQTGGFIYADSEVGRGTTFCIYLPRHVAAEGEEIPAQPVTPKDDKKKDLSGSGTVLLVEDEDAVRMGGMRALMSRGYTVHEAADGLEALDVLEELDGKVDIIVSDVVMPELDGPSLLREVRKHYPDVKFVFVSGYAEDAFAKNLPEGATFGFLPKPFSLKQLATKVKDTLEGE